MKKVISTGGHGDAFIVGLKLNELIKNGTFDSVDWLHVESINIGFQFERIAKGIFHKWADNAHFEHHPNYIQMVQDGHWKEREAIPVSFGRKCNLHKKILEVHDPFVQFDTVPQKMYDLTIQVSAGQSNNKKWIFDVVQFGQALVRNFGYSVCFIGNDRNFDFPEIIEEGLYSEVNSWQNINDAAWAINKSKAFVGFLGFMNYYACANKVPSVYLKEGPEQELDYFHEKWKPLTYAIKYPSFGEVMRGINHLRMTGVI